MQGLCTVVGWGGYSIIYIVQGPHGLCTLDGKEVDCLKAVVCVGRIIRQHLVHRWTEHVKSVDQPSRFALTCLC